MKRSEIKRRPLSDTVLAGLEPDTKEYREQDGNGLYFRVKPDGQKSWQLRYDFDLASYGVPGLTTSLWHAKGWGIDGTHYSGDRDGRNTGYNVRGLEGAKHNENGLMLAYVVQSGTLKNTVLRSIVYNHRASGGQIDGSYDEFRLVANVPISLF